MDECVILILPLSRTAVPVLDTLECGGFYLKLLNEDNFGPATLSTVSRSVIPFWPEKCSFTKNVHFIYRHQNSKTCL
jgi:hypothetical protein